MSSSRITAGGYPGSPIGFRLKRLALLIAVPLVVLLVLFLALWKTFFLYVPPGKMLIVISKGGADLKENLVLADDGEKGIMRRVRGEGWHFILPVVYTT